MADKLKTARKPKSVYIIGSITIGIIALLAVYFILIATGVISAEPTVIEITSASVAAEYDGNELTDDGWELTQGKLKDGHTLRVTVTGSQTEVGVSDNTFYATVYDERGYDVTDSYHIESVIGTLEVSPRKLVVQSASAEKDYDGTPLTAQSCAIVSGVLVGGHEIEYIVNGTLTASGKTENTFAVTITDGVRDVTHNYNVEKLFGTLYVHGDLLTITTGSASKVYDGTPLTCDEWNIVNNALADGDSAIINVIGSITNVGVIENTATCTVINAEGVNVTPRYEIDFRYGTLEVLPITFRLQTQSAYKTYDGTPLVADAWRIVTDGTLASDEWLTSGDFFSIGEYRITATIIGSQTDVGIGENTAVYVTVSVGSVIVDYVEIDYDLGDLIVDKRNLTIQTGDAIKEFDGTPLTNPEWEIVSITQPADGHTVQVAVVGSITLVGREDNLIAEVLIRDAAGNDVTRNYNIKEILGVLAITGNDLTNPGNTGEGDVPEGRVIMRVYSDKDSVLYLRERSYGSYTGTTDWGTAAEYGGAKPIVGGTAYSVNYLPNIIMENRALAATQARIERSGAGYCVPYYPTFDESNAVQTSDVNYTGTDEQYVFEYYDYAYTSDNGALLANYDLGEYAAIEQAYRAYVYENYLGVPTPTAEYMQSVIDARNFRKDDPQIVATVASYIQSAARYSREYNPALDREQDVAVAFLKTYKLGLCRHYATSAAMLFRTLGIPARYTIGIMTPTTAGEWVDVREGHAWVEVYIDGIGWLHVEVTGSDGGSPVPGEPTPTPDQIGGEDGIPIEIRPFNVYLKYSQFDGTPLTYNRDDLQGLSAYTAQGYTYTFTVTGSQDAVGIGKSTITEFVLYDARGNDVTQEFKITRKTGKLHIYIQEIAVKTQSLERVYDGTPLFSEADGGYSIVGGLIHGHSVGSVEMTGSQLNVGRSVNTYKLTVVDANGEDKTDNYKINSEYGTLRVTPRAIVVTAGSAVGYFTELNGEALTCNEFTVDSADGEGLGEGDVITVEITGSQKGIGRSANTIGEVTIANADGDDVSANYSVKYVDGTLTVLPYRLPNTNVEAV